MYRGPAAFSGGATDAGRGGKGAFPGVPDALRWRGAAFGGADGADFGGAAGATGFGSPASAGGLGAATAGLGCEERSCTVSFSAGSSI